MIPLIVITGPTACGKTPTAVALAKKIKGEIVSADSMQIYKGMDIGTAKPTMAERDGIPHHMLDIEDPKKDFSAAVFQQMARGAIEDIYSRGKIPILVGGTGFYIAGVVYENALTSEEDDNANSRELIIREELMKQAAQKGGGALHNRLKIVDPQSAVGIHPNNVKRVVRALAYYEANHKPISAYKRGRDLRYGTLFIVLNRDRGSLYETINRRVEVMINQGLIQEVEKLLAAGVGDKATAMQALGYKEIVPYLKGACSLEEAVKAIKQGSRRYAKRQLTWFRHQLDGHWLSMDDKTPEEAAEVIKELADQWFIATDQIGG